MPSDRTLRATTALWMTLGVGFVLAAGWSPVDVAPILTGELPWSEPVRAAPAPAPASEGSPPIRIVPPAPVATLAPSLAIVDAPIVPPETTAEAPSAPPASSPSPEPSSSPSPSPSPSPLPSPEPEPTPESEPDPIAIRAEVDASILGIDASVSVSVGLP